MNEDNFDWSQRSPLLDKNIFMEDKFIVWKSVLYRFLRGAIAGAVSAMVMLNLNGISTFADLKTLGTSLVIAGTVGFVSGGLLAIDKALRVNNN